MRMLPTSSLSSSSTSSSSTERWRECCTESLCCCSCSRKSPKCSWKADKLWTRGQIVPEKEANLWEWRRWILERKWEAHHGVKSDMMDALLSIDVNPHLSIVGWDHCLPYWHLAQGPAPSQIRLEWEYVVKSQRESVKSDIWQRSQIALFTLCLGIIPP